MAEHVRDVGMERRVLLLRRHGLVDHPKRQFGGADEEDLDLLRILQTRHLHENTIDALPLNVRLDQSQLLVVDPAFDDLN